MTGVSHWAVRDLQTAPFKRSNAGNEPELSRDRPDLRDELAVLVSDEPRVELGPWYRVRAAIDHDPHTGMRHKQTGRGISRGGLGTDANGDEPHSSPSEGRYHVALR